MIAATTKIANIAATIQNAAKNAAARKEPTKTTMESPIPAMMKYHSHLRNSIPY